jgi:hypothetical protein
MLKYETIIHHKSAIVDFLRLLEILDIAVIEAYILNRWALTLGENYLCQESFQPCKYQWTDTSKIAMESLAIFNPDLIMIKMAFINPYL